MLKIFLSFFLTFSAKAEQLELTDRNTVVLSGSINGFSMGDTAEKLYRVYENLDSFENVYLVIYSKGGIVEDAIKFIVTSRLIPTIYVVIVKAESAAAMISQTVSPTRYIINGANLMFHHCYRSFGGAYTYNEIEKEIQTFKARSDAFDALCKYRLSLSNDEYLKKIDGKDWVLNTKEAIKVHAADKLITVTCTTADFSAKVQDYDDKNKKLVFMCDKIKEIQKRN